MALSRLAPAKINLTLEVTSRRSDGYHEISSVMSTVSLTDTISVDSGRGFVMTADEDYDDRSLRFQPGDLNSVEQALALMVEQRARLQGQDPPGQMKALRQGIAQMAVRLRKRIPGAAGLGGGSSDAAGALRLFNEHWALGLDATQLTNVAAEIGSDCPFFLDGGVQLAGGRGEVLKSMPLPATSWLCIVRPPVYPSHKTQMLYSLLRTENWSDGSGTEALAKRLKKQPGSPDSTGVAL